MNVYGRDYHFALTVGATAEIAEMCPDGDISRLGDVFEGGYAKITRATAKFVVALSRGYEAQRAFFEDGYIPHPLTEEMVMTLDSKTFMALQAEAMVAFNSDQKGTVEVEAKKNEQE